MKNATIKSATAKWQIIRLIRDLRCLLDRKSVMITDKFPAAAITNITQYAKTTGTAASVKPENFEEGRTRTGQL